MSSKNRSLAFSLAINEALHQTMSEDFSVLLIGQGVKSPWYVGNTCQGLIEKFGPERVIDTPISENAITGAAVGAALVGMKPIVVHPRMDFMLYAMDPIVNEAANWRYMCGGRSSVPVVFWGIINRGGEQAAQHSQALHALFSHIPGLKVVMPSTPYDAKGLMVAAIRDPNPVVFIDDRWLYRDEGTVPEPIYEVEIGRAKVLRRGEALTVVGVSYMIRQAFLAANELEKDGVRVEVVDMRSAKPLDEKAVLKSVAKTGRLLIVDGGWKTGGWASEVAALVAEKAFPSLKTGIRRVTLPDVPAPASAVLEKAYYPDRKTLVRTMKDMLREK